MSAQFPRAVIELCYGHDAWIVGSGAFVCDEPPRDYDIMVPLSHWKRAALSIPPTARPNSFGGWKFNSDGIEVDVWPGELSDLMQAAPSQAAFHPKSGVFITKHKRCKKGEIA